MRCRVNSSFNSICNIETHVEKSDTHYRIYIYRKMVGIGKINKREWVAINKEKTFENVKTASVHNEHWRFGTEYQIDSTL